MGNANIVFISITVGKHLQLNLLTRTVVRALKSVESDVASDRAGRNPLLCMQRLHGCI